MSDVLDILTLAEGQAALPGIDATQNTELAVFITAVSRRLDELCGPIVVRTVTNDQYDDLDWSTKRIYLRYAPASRTSATTITTVTEYSSGTAQALAAETLTTSTGNDYRFTARTGILERRSNYSPTFFAPTVVVTYQAGRYATTAATDVKFKEAAKMMLAMLWRRERGQATQLFGGVIDAEAVAAGATYAVPNAVKELLADELRAPVMTRAG